MGYGSGKSSGGKSGSGKLPTKPVKNVQSGRMLGPKGGKKK